MAEIAGYNGQVDFGSVIDSDVCSYNTYSWSLDLNAETLETTDFCTDGWRDFIGGLKGWSGSVELYVDDSTRIVPSDIGTEATITLYLDNDNYIRGKAIWNSYSPSVAVDGIETQTIGFQGVSDLSTT